MSQFEGVFAVLPTPFNPDGDLDLPSLRRVIQLYIGAGVNGLTALGVMGEAARLSDRERQLVLEAIMSEARHRLPVVVGASAATAKACAGYAAGAREAGAAAVMISPPPMETPDPEAVLRHLQDVAALADIPIVLQDYPKVTGYSMDPSILAGLVRQIPQIVAIKLEDPPTAPKIAQIRSMLPDGRIAIFGGLGGMYLLDELLAGAAGAMTGFAFPEALVEIVRLFRAGSLDRATERFQHYAPLLRFEFQEGIGLAIRKEVLRRRGALQWSAVRHPARPLDPETSAALDALLEQYRTTASA